MLVEYQLRPGGPLTYSIRGRSWKFGLKYRTSDPKLIEFLQSRTAFEVTEVEPPKPPDVEPEPEPEAFESKRVAPKRGKRSYVTRKPGKKRS